MALHLTTSINYSDLEEYVKEPLIKIFPQFYTSLHLDKVTAEAHFITFFKIRIVSVHVHRERCFAAVVRTVK